MIVAAKYNLVSKGVYLKKLSYCANNVETSSSANYAYFETDILPNNDTTAELKVGYVSPVSAQWMQFFGGGHSYYGNNGFNLGFNCDPYPNVYVFSSFGRSYKDTRSPSFNLRTTTAIIKLNSSGVYVDGNSITTYTPNFSSSVTTYPIWILACNQNGVLNGSTLRGRFYYAKIYSNNVLTHAFYPYLLDGRVILVDEINGTIIEQSGNGTLVGEI